MRLVLGCPACQSLTVHADELPQAWTRDRGVRAEFVTGSCSRCESVVLIAPTQAAVERVARRLRLRKAAVSG